MPHDQGRAFAIGTALNLAYVVLEAGFGLVAGSLALLADAEHNPSDVLGLIDHPTIQVEAGDPARPCPLARAAAPSGARPRDVRGAPPGRSRG